MNMNSIRLMLRCNFVLAAVLAVLAGCSRNSPSAPADPDRARDALRSSLDAWQQGETPHTLKERRPAIFVVDYEWTGGHRLLRYQIEKDELIGNQLRCHVRLTVQNQQGRVVQQAAAYSVDTDPVVTVHRDDF
jgi:hypothetical protein